LGGIASLNARRSNALWVKPLAMTMASFSLMRMPPLGMGNSQCRAPEMKRTRSSQPGPRQQRLPAGRHFAARRAGRLAGEGAASPYAFDKAIAEPYNLVIMTY